MTDYDWRTKDELRKRIEELEAELLQARVAGDIYVEHLKAEVEDLRISNRQAKIDNAQLQAKNQQLRAENEWLGNQVDGLDDAKENPFDANPGRPYPLVWLEEEGYR